MDFKINKTLEYFNYIKNKPSYDLYKKISIGLSNKYKEICNDTNILKYNIEEKWNDLLIMNLYDNYDKISDWTIIIEQNKNNFLLNDLFRDKILDPLIVPLDEFKLNLNCFTNGIFEKMDWNNVCVMGGVLSACVLPIPEKYRENCFTRRDYFHNIGYKGSDIDLYIYGLDEKAATDKLISLCNYFKELIPMCEISFLRTCYTVTIVTRFPYRHIQIVAKIYNNIPELLLGVDVDCTSICYNGDKVYTTCRAFQSLITRCNSFNFVQPSANMSGRLIKYATRGFAVHILGVDTSKISPSIYLSSSKDLGEIAKLYSYNKIGGDDKKDSFMNAYNPYKQENKRRGRRRRNARENFGSKANDYSAVYLPWDISISVDSIVNKMESKNNMLNDEKSVKSRGYHYHPCFCSIY